MMMASVGQSCVHAATVDAEMIERGVKGTGNFGLVSVKKE
jgi:hypothetical protein